MHIPFVTFTGYYPLLPVPFYLRTFGYHLWLRTGLLLPYVTGCYYTGCHTPHAAALHACRCHVLPLRYLPFSFVLGSVDYVLHYMPFTRLVLHGCRGTRCHFIRFLDCTGLPHGYARVWFATRLRTRLCRLPVAVHRYRLGSRLRILPPRFTLRLVRGLRVAFGYVYRTAYVHTHLCCLHGCVLVPPHTWLPAGSTVATARFCGCLQVGSGYILHTALDCRVLRFRLSFTGSPLPPGCTAVYPLQHVLLRFTVGYRAPRAVRRYRAAVAACCVVPPAVTVVGLRATLRSYCGCRTFCRSHTTTGWLCRILPFCRITCRLVYVTRLLPCRFLHLLPRLPLRFTRCTHTYVQFYCGSRAMQVTAAP